MNKQQIDEIRKKACVFDIETCSTDPVTKQPINISTDFERYVQYAKVKWIGIWSYKYNTYVGDIVAGNEEKIYDFLQAHDILIGFNSIEFDYPCLINNSLVNDEKRFMHVDMLQILGSSTFKGHEGLSFKNRGLLMGFKFKRNSLRVVAETMGCEIQKGDIDYNIFFKDVYTQQEIEDIKKYLYADVMATKELFDKCWTFWFPFTEFLDDKNIKNLSWIRSSIAALTYKCACNYLGIEETYDDSEATKKEPMGGRVIDPRVTEARDVWYVDVRSLYPHVIAMFNLFAECDNGIGWHGNELFKTKGYYSDKEQHPLGKYMMQLLAERIKLKKSDPKSPRQYAIKILLNSLYGAARSHIFQGIHCPNLGWDTCYIGQQINEYMEKRMSDLGFDTLAGDTDSIFVKARDKSLDDETYVKTCLSKIATEINANALYPQETFEIEIEGKLSYIKWDKKKNYVYIKDGEVTIMGLPCKKDNATALGKRIVFDHIVPKIKQEGHASFSKSYIRKLLDDMFDVKYMVQEYKVKEYRLYKNPSQLQAQISREYFGGNSGVISLIKNKRVGRVGKSWKYCSVDEATVLTRHDVDITKIMNELQPFCNGEI